MQLKEALKKIGVEKIVRERIDEFRAKNKKPNEEWFSELCFCILTANSKAKTAINIQNELGFKGFSEKSEEELAKVISKNKHRFSGMKAKYLVNARKYINIKGLVEKLLPKGQEFARNELAKTILGIGLKEASHFMRNIGFFDLAILDRHILALLKEYGYIEKVPKTLTKNEYFRIEKIFQGLAREMDMVPAELDLTMWCMRTGEVLK